MFDCAPFSMDLHNGCIVAIPARNKGLIAKEVVVIMACHWLTVFGIPLTISATEDLGLQALGSRLCARSWELAMPRASPT